MLKTWYTTALAALVALGVVIAAATRWGIYPLGVIVLLGAAIVGLVAVVLQSRMPPADTTAIDEHDAWVVREVRTRVSRNDVETLVEWHFGASWRQEYVSPFMRLTYDLDNVEHRPRDEQLGEAFRALLDATHDFLEYYSYNTFPSRVLRSGEDVRDVGWAGAEAEDLEGDERELWRERVRILESLADDIGHGYDSFIDLARRRGILSIEN